MIQEVPFGTKIEKATYIYIYIYIFTRDFMVQYHNYLCAVCKNESAVADCDTGILQPCWTCQSNGYVIVKINWLVKFIDKIGFIK